MRRVIANSRSPQKTIEITGSTTKYDISSTKCLTNLETASAGTSTTEVRFARKSNRYQILRKQNENYKQIFLAELLKELFSRRKRYSFQMLKLVYMFPDDTFSENISVNSYDRLFYQDEHIHTIVKIYQTKEMESKIWAFLNLKNLHKKRKLQKFTSKIENVQKKLITKAAKASFQMIHQYSIKIAPQRKTVKIQRMEPIITKVQLLNNRKEQEIKIKEVQKTQRTNLTDNTYRIERNEIIRVDQTSPIVRRIQLSPDIGMKVIYPSTVRNPQEHRSVQTSRIRYHQPLSTQYFKQKQINQTKTMIEEKKVSQPAKTVIYSGETVRKQPIRTIPYQVEPIRTVTYQAQPIRTTPYYLQRPAQITTYQGRNNLKSHYNDYGYLVHRVEGNCTINIHNGYARDHSSIYQQKRHRSASRHRHFSGIAATDSRIVFHQSNNHRCCCESAYQIAHQTCHCNECCLPHHSHSHHSNHISHISQRQNYKSSNFQYNPYYIEERIMYLKSLQQANNNKLNYSKGQYR